MNFTQRTKYSVLLIVFLLSFSESIFANENGVADTNKKNLTLSASATFTSNYIWRGLNCGGPALQLDATIDYKGFFANMWWNVGAEDWTFNAFSPEVDLTIGYSRNGLSIYYIHMYYFDTYANGERSRFFDFSNHPRGGGGTTGEWRLSYSLPITVAKNLPQSSFSFLVGVRTFGRDGYINEEGELVRAYSSYIEVGYDQPLGENWTLAARVGVTPAKSLYTAYQGDFAVTLVGLKLQKQWALKYGQMTAFANVMLQPWQVTKDNLICPIENAGDQKLNLAVGMGYSI